MDVSSKKLVRERPRGYWWWLLEGLCFDDLVDLILLPMVSMMS